MTITLALGWWMIPAAITLIGLAWSIYIASIDKWIIATLLAFAFSTIVSLLAWLIYVGLFA